MPPESEDQNEAVPTVFESWYESMEIEDLILLPIYRNLLNADITLKLNSHILNRYAVQEGRLNRLVIPQINSFAFELLAIENDIKSDKRYANIKLYLQTALTKDSEVESLCIEIKVGLGSTYTLKELVDGNFMSFFDLPPLMLFQVKEIDALGCKVKIGPIDSVEC